MGLFSRLFEKTKVQPQEQYIITITDEAIKVNYPNQSVESILWTEINVIVLINTNAGPSQPDIWLALKGDNNCCTIPHDSDEFEKIYNIISKYEGFNFDNFIKSMSCADNAEFLLWTKTE
jgi:hypothetical protein